jgi:EAL and modified HD-GYP domain-containing signal transduction protein
MQEVLQSLPLSDSVKAALLSYEGLLGTALRCVISYERGDWHEVQCASLDRAAITDAYLQAIAWAAETSSQLIA